MLTDWNVAAKQQQQQQQAALESQELKTVKGVKSESTADVGDSKKLDDGSVAIAISTPSTSGGGGAGVGATAAGSSSTISDKVKVELDSRVVHFREMDRNFERILTSVAMVEREKDVAVASGSGHLVQGARGHVVIEGTSNSGVGAVAESSGGADEDRVLKTVEEKEETDGIGDGLSDQVESMASDVQLVDRAEEGDLVKEQSKTDG